MIFSVKLKKGKKKCKGAKEKMSTSGKAVMHKTITLTQGTQNIPVDVSRFTPGMYYVSIYGMGLSETQKLVVLKQ